MTLDTNIKTLCYSRGITRAALAAKVGVSASSLSGSVKNNPTLALLVKIATALNVTLSELVADDTTPSAATVCPHCKRVVRVVLE